MGFGASAGEGGEQPSAAASASPPEKPSLKDILSKLDAGSIDAQSALDAIRGASQDGPK
jgi:hypothetical protein